MMMMMMMMPSDGWLCDFSDECGNIGRRVLSVDG